MAFTPAIMLQGTGSDVGKSLLTAGLCRAFLRRGLKVRPFKPQNMSNNAAVTAEGGEIGRAQALQARACGLAPTTDMNPVLLKPQTDIGAQVIVCGKIWGSAQAEEYQALKSDLLPAVLESFERLAADADLVLVDPDRPYKVDKSNLLCKCHWSPFQGHEFTASIDTTISGSSRRIVVWSPLTVTKIA